jgi:hypothetical protein
VSGNEPSHSQREFNFGSWSPSTLLNFQKEISGVKTPCLKEFLYTIGKLLELRRLKWVRIAHLDI